MKIAIDDELAARELAHANRVHEAVDGRNTSVIEGLLTARTELVPQLLQLVLDAAQDEISTAWVNSRFPQDRWIRNADAATRSVPAQTEHVVNSEIVKLWEAYGRPVSDQSQVQVDDDGRGFLKSPAAP